MNSVQQFRRVVGKTDHRQLIGFRFPVKKPVYRRSTCAFARHSLKAVEVAIEVTSGEKVMSCLPVNRRHEIQHRKRRNFVRFVS